MKTLTDRDIRLMGVTEFKVENDPWKKFACGVDQAMMMKDVERRSGSDRRVALSTFIDPRCDRRSGFERRKK